MRTSAYNCPTFGSIEDRMFDYIRIEAKGKAQAEYLTPVKDWEEMNYKTGDRMKFSKYEFGPLNIFQYSGRFEVEGSIHYFWNWINAGQEKDNYSRFDFDSFCIAVDTLCEVLGTTPEDMKTKGYEYGFNLPTSFDPEKFGLRNLIGLRRAHIELKKNYDSKGVFRAYGKDDRILKVYDKAKQKVIPGHLLRIENKITKSRAYRAEIKTIGDLKRWEVWEYLKGKLSETIRGEMVIIDDPGKYPYESNPKFWEGCKNRTARKRAFDRLPFSKMKTEILNLIETILQEMKEGQGATLMEAARGQVLRLHNESRAEKTNETHKEGQKNKCLVTGLDISHQIPRSRFISEKTISALPDETFNDLARKYLTERKQGHTWQRKAYYIAHNIRNAYHNPRQKKVKTPAAVQVC